MAPTKLTPDQEAIQYVISHIFNTGSILPDLLNQEGIRDIMGFLALDIDVYASIVVTIGKPPDSYNFV